MNPIDDALLKMVCCPVTKSELGFADPELIEHLNQQIKVGELTNRMGEKVDRILEGGLINSDVSLLHPICGDIVTLVADQAIVLVKTRE